METSAPLSRSRQGAILKVKAGLLLLTLGTLSGCDAAVPGSQKSTVLRSAPVLSASSGLAIEPVETALAQLNFEDHQGHTRTLAELAGSHVALMLGFTQCPVICPTGMMQWNQAIRSLPTNQARRLQFVFLTVDPQRDTQAVLARYVPYFNPDFIGLRADPETQSTALSALHAFARKVPSAKPGEYSMDHTATVFLIDAKGNKVEEVRYGSDVETIARHLHEVLG